ALTVALKEGADPRVLIEVRRVLARPFEIGYLPPDQFDRLLSERYADGTAADAAGSIGLGDELSHIAGDIPTAEDLLDSADDAPAIRLINGIIADAARQRVSDIHIEPYEKALTIRMRIDGVLRETLGMPPEIDKLYRDALAEPNGIVLVTGPTGSGKTTTLYAGLRLLNDGSRNILTVEDPVEYAVDGVGQTQVNPKVGLSFAAGLRA